MSPFLFVLLVVFVIESTEEESVDVGVVFRLTQKGLTYALNTILESIKKLNISAFGLPTVNETTSNVNYWIQSLNFTDYADLNASVVMDKKPGLNITVHTLSVNLHGKVQCRDTVKSKNVQSCSVKMTITGGGYFLAYIGRDEKGRFTAWMKHDKDNCFIPPPNLKINYTNCEKPEDSICAANSSEFKEKIIMERLNQTKLCMLLGFFFMVRGDEEVNNIELTPRIKNVPFVANLLMPFDPKYESTFVNTYHKGEIMWYPTMESYFRNSTANYTLHNDSSKMAYVWMSRDVIQSLLEGFQKHGRLHYKVTPENVQNLKPGNWGLNTTCTERVCVGRLVPELKERYPNQYMDLEIYSLETPHVRFEKNLAVLKFHLVMFAYIRDPVCKTSTVIAKLLGTADIRIKVFMNDSLFRGEVIAFEPYLEKLESTVHGFDVQTVNFIITGAVVVTVEPLLNEFGRAGIPLPISEKIQLYNTTIDLIENAIVIGSDIRYNGTVH